MTEGGVRVPTKPLLHWNFGTRRARLVVFPIRGRNWCFSRSIDLAASDSASTQILSTLKDLLTKIPSSSSSKSDALSRGTGRSNAEIVTDFISFKVLHILFSFVSLLWSGIRFDRIKHRDVMDVRWIKRGLLLRRLLKNRLKINFTGKVSPARFY